MRGNKTHSYSSFCIYSQRLICILLLHMLIFMKYRYNKIARLRAKRLYTLFVIPVSVDTKFSTYRYISVALFRLNYISKTSKKTFVRTMASRRVVGVVAYECKKQMYTRY